MNSYQTNCFYCGVFLHGKSTQPTSKTRDHLTPRSRGGTGVNNIVFACRKCNGDKGGLNLEEYRAVISLRFGSLVKFWGEGQSNRTAPAITPLVPKQEPIQLPKPMRLPGALLLVDVPKFRPVATDDPRHKRKLADDTSPEIVLGPDGALWDECPPIDLSASYASALVGRTFGLGLTCVGVILGVKSKAKYACRCRCGKFTARSSLAVKNDKNKLDACGFCIGGNWMKYNYPYCEQYQRERWEDEGGLAA